MSCLLLAVALCGSLPTGVGAAEEATAESAGEVTGEVTGDAAEEATGEATEEAVQSAAHYTRLAPDILVNLRGSGGHYLMVTAEVQTRSAADVEKVMQHAPAIRHHMLMSMGEMGYREALTVEGRQKLADDSLAIIRRVLDEETGANEVVAVLFTSYLVE